MEPVVMLIVFSATCVAAQPHIIFILADDLGWNDVGFHGSNQIPTPNIDTLAYTGIILNNYYVAPVCTPSRSALMTGKYPIHTGLQHGVIHGSAPYGLPLTETLLPQLLRPHNYSSHAVGKWHMGSHRKEYTPCYRGFDTHYGYWVGHQDYYDHTSQENLGYWGFDMRRGSEITWSDYGQYTTDLFTKEAVQIIQDHNQSKPLFLYLAHLATHSANPYRPLQAPAEVVQRFQRIKNLDRRIFAGMLSKLDDSVGAVVAALERTRMLSNTIIVFSTDNGGPAAGFNSNAASNWPLRGVKDTLWEGGVRGAGLVWSPLLPSGKVSQTLLHITDWLPTLLHAATGEQYTRSGLDGHDVWNILKDMQQPSRKEVLLNIDHQRTIAGLISGEWKLVLGNTWNGTWDGWYGPSGRQVQYDWTSLWKCPAAEAIKSIRPLPSKETIKELRAKAAIMCKTKQYKRNPKKGSPNVYLFNLKNDPCETENLAETEEIVLKAMLSRLEAYNKTIVAPRNKPADPRSNPKFWGYTWINWMDFV